mgnify:CR=1 FL=1
MKELVNNMLAEIEVNISEIDLYGYDIVETFSFNSASFASGSQ